MMIPHNLIPRIEFGVQALFRRQRSCPFCESRKHSVVARKNGVVRIRRCQECFLYFTDPIYRSKIGELYESLYHAEGSTTTLPDKATLDALRAANFGGSDKNCAAQLEALKRLTAGRALLEIGSSWGYFLDQANAAGFATVGVEPGQTRREFGVRQLGVDIRESVQAVCDAQFDVIYCAHTLEHITDVGPFFSNCRRRLRDGGLLAIEVPHFDLATLGSGVLSIIGAVHPLGLSPSFFQFALPHTGFTVVGIYDDWKSVPSHPVVSPRAGNLIAIAEKIPAHVGVIQ
jgi:SAM-dependent methyltransferase